MTEQLGIVTRAERKGWAHVAIQGSTACSGCLSIPPTLECRTCGSDAVMESRAANPIGARSGDLVRVHMASVNIITGAAAIYLLPVACMLLGALAAVSLFNPSGWHESSLALAGSWTGLILGWGAAKGLDRAGRFGRDWNPTIRQILLPRKELELRLKTPTGEL